MPTPAPAADQNATPVYGVRYPKASSKALMLPRDFEDIAEDIEQVMLDLGIPPVISGTPVVAASAAARNAHWGTPTTASARLALQNSGAVTIRTDLGWTEQYFANLTDGGSNPGGVAVAGWYPVSVQGGWVNWATAPTGLTVGVGGVIVQRYKWVGTRAWIDYSYTLGSSGFSVVAPTINLPFAVHVVALAGSLASGDGAIRDVSVPSTPAFTRVNVGTSLTALIGTYNGSFAGIDATHPIAGGWGPGDVLAGGFWVDPA